MQKYYRNQYGTFPARGMAQQQEQAFAGLIQAEQAKAQNADKLNAVIEAKQHDGAWCDPAHQYRFMGQHPDRIVAPILSTTLMFGGGRGEQTYCSWRMLAFRYRVNTGMWVTAYLQMAELFWAVCGGGMLAGSNVKSGSVNGWDGELESASHYPLLNDLCGGQTLTGKQIRDCIGRSMVHTIVARGLANTRYAYGYYDKVKAPIGADYLQRGVDDVRARGYLVNNVAQVTVPETGNALGRGIAYNAGLYREGETVRNMVEMQYGPEYKNYNSSNVLRLHQLYITGGDRYAMAGPVSKQEDFRAKAAITSGRVYNGGVRAFPDCITAYWERPDYWGSFPRTPMNYQNNLNI